MNFCKLKVVFPCFKARYEPHDNASSFPLDNIDYNVKMIEKKFHPT